MSKNLYKRAEVIDILNDMLRQEKRSTAILFHYHRIQALKYAIRSLEIDEAYQLEYENYCGKWINHTHTSGCGITFLDYECNCCHQHTDYPSNFCPDCGRKMSGKCEEGVEP